MSGPANHQQAQRKCVSLSSAFLKTHFSKNIESLKHPLHLFFLFLSEFVQQRLQLACLFVRKGKKKVSDSAVNAV